MQSDPLQLLKELSESFGPSGFERETAAIVKREAKRYADEVTFDKLGSIVAKKRGSSDSPKVLLAGHIDEVGFVVTGIDEQAGFLTFSPLGGWFDQVLLGHRVTVRTARGPVPGVIAAKPPHLLSPEERDKVVKKDSMFIDVGANSRETTEKELGVSVGDPVAPWAPFTTARGGKVAIGKAFDDRVGTFVGLEVLRRLKEEKVTHPNMVFVAGTVQEEVGLRGASTVGNMVEPDLAIALEVDISGDVPGIKRNEAPAKMGKGPSILAFDASMIPNQAFKSLVVETAEQEKIPYQISVIPGGGTDAGKFHVVNAGAPSIVIGVPTRHIHSHAAILDVSDIGNAINLVLALLRRLDEKTVKSFVEV
ncbi:MAG: M42 family metallopeptidase [Nitrososphaerota archaeon]|nr:M42 family metallopeptidase [Nitrososphaerota archaeon]MDG6955282.1 M42 family metallopeptidase [Nitrososphaerota archaeon]